MPRQMPFSHTEAETWNKKKEQQLTLQAVLAKH